MNANDSTETGEVPLTCNAGAGVGDDKSVLQIGINDGCGSFVEVAVYAAPNAFVCDIAASAGNWVCVIAHGHAYADTRNATDAEMADLDDRPQRRRELRRPRHDRPHPPQLRGRRAGHADRALRPGGAGVLERQGRRRRRRGRRARVRQPIPTPAAASPADTSEDSEVGLPAGCTVGGGIVESDEKFPAVEVSGCGSVDRRVVQAVGDAERLRLRDRRPASRRAR